MLGNIDRMFDTDSFTQGDEFNESSNVSDEAFWENTPFSQESSSSTQELPQELPQELHQELFQGNQTALSQSFISPIRPSPQESSRERQCFPQFNIATGMYSSSVANNPMNIPHGNTFANSDFSSSFHIMQDQSNQSGTSPASSTGSFTASHSSGLSSSFNIPPDNFSPQFPIQPPPLQQAPIQPPLQAPLQAPLGSLDQNFSGDNRKPSSVTIIDVSPDWVESIGGSKLLLVLNSKLDRPNHCMLQCGFSSSVSQEAEDSEPNKQHTDLCINNWRWVEAEMLSDSVVRCHVPPHPPGPVTVVIAAYFPGPDNQLEHRRELLAVSGFGDTTTMLTYRSLWRSSTSSSHKSNTPKFADSIAHIQSPTNQSNNLPLPAFKGKRFSKPTEGVDRESKIRIVHKLEKVESSIALQASTQQEVDTDTSATDHAFGSGNTSKESSSASSSYTVDGGSDESNDKSGSGDDYDALIGLLDDDALTNICEQELEEVLEGMLMRVVDQMVELAGSDDDLRGELNAPDKNGKQIICVYLFPLIVFPFSLSLFCF